MDREDWNRRYAGKELIWTGEANRFLAEEVADLEPGPALDLACGEGRNAVWLAEQGWSVTAVDYSEVGLDKGRRLAEERGVSVRWLAADLSDWQPAPGAFELVVIAYLHIPRPALGPIWRAAAMAVAPGGTLLVIGHDATNMTDGHGGPPDGAVLYTAEQVVSALAGLEVKLEIEKAGKVLRQVDTDDGPRTAIDNLVRARRIAAGG